MQFYPTQYKVLERLIYSMSLRIAQSKYVKWMFILSSRVLMTFLILVAHQSTV